MTIGDESAFVAVPAYLRSTVPYNLLPVTCKGYVELGVFLWNSQGWCEAFPGPSTRANLKLPHSVQILPFLHLGQSTRDSPPDCQTNA
ncbi:unnamed protein product [Fusarium graminearum]|uniref:Chromosome 2, complete genome n=1 Tax=Gibberella zeae (strain ATCC MYA-4620 / CBS 123657 / FGSC 9075 / NRRL 31084 / PH-1) TaxID=229533 RepID=A0A098DFJ6_GIBZE|nr:unnamed protein product [Fusarium graminearum]